jgi:hypothetical protein
MTGSGTADAPRRAHNRAYSLRRIWRGIGIYFRGGSVTRRKHVKQIDTTKLAFIGTPITHAELLAEMREHQRMDRFVQGQYWENGRGCAVGCAIESINRRTSLQLAFSDHASYGNITHVPAEIFRLQDRLFEMLPRSEAIKFPVQFLEAIREGSDLSGVLDKFFVRMLLQIVAPVAGANEGIVRRMANGIACGWTNGDTRENATARAAWAAWAAGAARAAEAAWAAGAARAAEAAWAAWAAEAMRDILLDELRSAPLGAFSEADAVRHVLEIT